jgi:outer membrane protein assembly factor BamB
VAYCYEARTGTLAWKERLGEEHASLVSAAGLVYFLNDQGVMNVVKLGAQFERVAQNEIHEKCFASPALSNGHIFLRGEKHLFCIGCK